MNEIVTMSERAISDVRRLEDAAMGMPQVAVETTHTFHAGVYARTVLVPAGVAITGALVKIPTVLIVAGDVVMYADGGAKDLSGYNVFSAAPRRKQAFVAKSDTYLTMIFATEAATVEEAENEFTDEGHLLVSRQEG